MVKSLNYRWLVIPIIIIVYWQVSFFTATLKWDFLDVVFPFRYHFSTSMAEGFFPLWNPYIHTGSPFFADLQAPTYYPELILVSTFGGYTIYWLHILFIAYIGLSAIGIIQLLQHLGYSKWTAFISSIIYACSGYFIGHGQHLFLLIGGCWLPWVIYAYLKFIEEQKLKTAIVLLVFLFLMLSGSYQALSICLFYLLLILFIVKLSYIIKNQKNKLGKFIGWHFGVGVFLVVLMSPILFATLEIRPDVVRLSEGVSWEKTAQYGQTLKSLISLITPISVAKTTKLFNDVDSSMLNWNVGILGLFFFFFGFFAERKLFEWILFGYGILIGSMSFAFLPTRKLMFDYVPFMNLFLQGPYVRVFLILGVVVFIASGLEKWSKKSTLSWKDWLFPFLIIGCLFVIIGVKFASIQVSNLYEVKNNLLEGWKNVNPEFLISINLFLSFLILTLVIVFGFLIKNKKRKQLFLSILVLTEFFLLTQWNQTETVVDRKFNPIEVNNSTREFPSGFPIPNLVPIGFNDDQHAFTAPLWRNTYIFQKQISFNGFSSFELNSYSYIDDQNIKLKEFILKRPLVYLCDTILSLKAIYKTNMNDSALQRSAFCDEKTFNKLKNLDLRSSTSDKLKIVGFSPNQIEMKLETKFNQLLIFNQSNNRNWRAYVDGQKVRIHNVNKNYQAIVLPKGKHFVYFSFEKKSIIILFFVSQLTFWILITLLIYKSLPTQIKWFKPLLLTLPFLFIGIWGFHIFRPKTKTIKVNQQKLLDWKNFEHVKSYKSKGQVCLTSEIEFHNIGSWKITNELLSSNFIRLMLKCKMNQSDSGLLFIEIKRNGKSIRWDASKVERQIELSNNWNSVIFSKNISSLKENDELLLCFWNINKKNIQLDKIRVDFLRN